MTALDWRAKEQQHLWASTQTLAREHGLPVKTTEQRVRAGELIPTFRTPSGQARWRRDDFAAQVTPPATAPLPTRFPTGVVLWEGSGWQVAARPGHPITVQVGRRTLLLDAELARSLALLLPLAADTTDTRPPGCTCRELLRGGRVQALIPVPSCPVHQGRTP